MRTKENYNKNYWCFVIGFLWIITGIQCYGQCIDRSFIGSDHDCSFFPVLCWDTQSGWNDSVTEREHGLKSIQECNFTIAGFVQRTSDLKECDNLGIKVLAFGDSDTTRFGHWNRMWESISDKEIEQKIINMVNRTKNYSSVIGYYLCDEPGATEFSNLARAVKYVKKYAPGKLAYINLFPGYATLGAPDLSQLETDSYEEYLEQFVNIVKPQFISYDNYMVEASVDMSEDSIKKSKAYFDDLLLIRQKSIKYGLPFWNIVASNQINPKYSIPSPSNLLFQVYTTLAAGGRGVSWFTYYLANRLKFEYAPINRTDQKTQTWYYLEELNRQLLILGPIMNRLSSTGVYFKPPAPYHLMPVLPGRLVKQILAETPIMVGEFKSDQGVDYLIVVNLSLEESVRFEISLQDLDRKITLIDPADGEFIPFNKDGHWLVAGQGVLLKLD